MNLKNWKGIYEYICLDRALVLCKKNLPGRGLTKFEKHCRRDMSPDLFTLKTAMTFAATSGNIHCSTCFYSERRLNCLDSVGTVYAIRRGAARDRKDPLRRSAPANHITVGTENAAPRRTRFCDVM
jgi:hypothetical protein